MQNWVLTELDSGERVISERLEHVRSVAVGYWIGAGSRDETDATAGHLALHRAPALQGHGALQRARDRRDLRRLGGELNAATSREHTLVYSRVPDNHVETALDVMGDMVFSPLFDDLDSEREVVLEEIAMYEDTPQELVHDLIAEAVFGSHPLGRPVIGTAEVISTVSRRAIAGYHRAMYAPREHRRRRGRQHRPRPARRARRAAVERRAAATDGKPRARPPLVQHAEAGPALPAQGHRAVPRLPRRARRSRAPTARRFAASILDAILGGSASSRLFQEIREKRGMAYSVYSFASQYADTGQIGDLRRHARGQPRRGARDRGRADRRHRRPAASRARELERAKENLKGRRAALDGVDLDAHEPARQVARHRHRDPLARPGHRRDRRGRGRARSASSPRTLLAPERLSAAGIGPSEERFLEALERRRRRARARGVKILLNG